MKMEVKTASFISWICRAGNDLEMVMQRRLINLGPFYIQIYGA